MNKLFTTIFPVFLFSISSFTLPSFTKSASVTQSASMERYASVTQSASMERYASVTQSASMERVLVALRTGNAEQLSKYFDSRIDISLPDKSENYSRNQAEMILKDFFASNEVRNFVVKHKGENNGSEFCIGSLQTRSGNFRTKLYMKSKGSQQVVQEISFQPED